MLNISDNTISEKVSSIKFKAFKVLRKKSTGRIPIILVIIIGLLSAIALFLPWTQNVRVEGYLTTLKPGQKPQAVPSIIAGRVEKWYVQEGDLVQAGDTIAFLSEVKSEYLDPDLVARTSEQAEAKNSSIASYQDKITSLERQYRALEESRNWKLKQVRNKLAQTRLKISNDSTDLVAEKINLGIAGKQLLRTQQLFDKGLKPLTDLETKKMKQQEVNAKVSVKQNKIFILQNELIQLNMQLSAVRNEYEDKLAKSKSEQFSTRSSQLDAVASTSKLRNQLSNYNQRQSMHYVRSPQSGYVTKVVKKGIGEIVKEGADLITIMPEKIDLAVEVYVLPQDLPLLENGQVARLQFDGWPAVIFSGWPNSSFGTFPGKIFAIDPYISENGKYRVLVSPDAEGKVWPNLLRVGSGTKAILLLNNVPLWYEIWRQLNGFPADFYKNKKEKEKNIKTKAPLRSVK